MDTPSTSRSSSPSTRRPRRRSLIERRNLRRNEASNAIKAVCMEAYRVMKVLGNSAKLERQALCSRDESLEGEYVMYAFTKTVMFLDCVATQLEQIKRKVVDLFDVFVRDPHITGLEGITLSLEVKREVCRLGARRLPPYVLPDRRKTRLRGPSSFSSSDDSSEFVDTLQEKIIAAYRKLKYMTRNAYHLLHYYAKTADREMETMLQDDCDSLLLLNYTGSKIVMYLEYIQREVGSTKLQVIDEMDNFNQLVDEKVYMDELKDGGILDLDAEPELTDSAAENGEEEPDSAYSSELKEEACAACGAKDGAPDAGHLEAGSVEAEVVDDGDAEMLHMKISPREGDSISYETDGKLDGLLDVTDSSLEMSEPSCGYRSPSPKRRKSTD